MKWFKQQALLALEHSVSDDGRGGIA